LAAPGRPRRSAVGWRGQLAGGEPGSEHRVPRPEEHIHRMTFDDPFQARGVRSSDPSRALDLLEQQATALSAAAAPAKIDYQGDERRYRARRRELEAILDQLGIRSPFPWDSLAECLAWGKTEFPQNYAARRADILARKDRVAELLQRRIDDHAA